MGSFWAFLSLTIECGANDGIRYAVAFADVCPLILETVGWEYKNILIPPGVIFGLSVSWAWIAWQATEVYQKEWSELLHPATESKDHKSSRKRLFDIIALLSTFSYIFTCVILIGLVGQKYLIFIILLGILAVFRRR